MTNSFVLAAQWPQFDLPTLPSGWAYFSTWQDALFTLVSLGLAILFVIWWRQQSRQWFRVVMTALLGALLFCIGSYYIFVVYPYQVGCDELCTGWRGFPRPVAVITLEDQTLLGPLDFLANLILLWLILLTVAVVWRILIISLGWRQRSLRTKIVMVLAVWVIPWALLPRFLDPPQPTVAAEDQRVANNALRTAEFTYRITGLWVQRLALEDIRQARGEEGFASLSNDIASKQVCLKGYTYFYLPWSRYRILLEASGVSSVRMIQMPLGGSCWQ